MVCIVAYIATKSVLLRCQYMWFSTLVRGTTLVSLIVSFMGPTWGQSGADRTQVGSMLAPWTLLSGVSFKGSKGIHIMMRLAHSTPGISTAIFRWVSGKLVCEIGADLGNSFRFVLRQLSYFGRISPLHYRETSTTAYPIYVFDELFQG